MAVMEAALIDLIKTNAPIAAVVGPRVTPLRRQQGGAFPAIVVTRVSGQPLYADDGEVGLQEGRVQIDSYALNYTDAKTLAQQVRALLSAYSGIHASINFSYIMLDEERDLTESGANAAEYPTRIAMDFIVWTRG